MSLREWLRHGFLNTMEHAITRVGDALATIVLVWALSPEVFAKLVDATSLIAPCLFLFLAPEAVLYRDFAIWRAEGGIAFSSRLHSLRLFAWGKAAVAVLISVPLAFALHGS